MAEATIEVVHSPDECLVTLGGEIDVTVQEAIYRDVVAALDECPDASPAVVIDLSAVTFLDSSGLGALVEIRKQARERGQRAALRKPNARVRRVLEIARIDSLFDIE